MDEEEKQRLRTIHIIELYRLARWVMSVLGVALLLYVGIVLPLSYTAGKQTGINVFFKAVLDLDLFVILPWVGVAVLFVLWRVERFIRKTSVRREHTRVEKLEKDRNPNRTSSGLEE